MLNDANGREVTRAEGGDTPPNDAEHSSDLEDLAARSGLPPEQTPGSDRVGGKPLDVREP